MWRKGKGIEGCGQGGFERAVKVGWEAVPHPQYCSLQPPTSFFLLLLLVGWLASHISSQAGLRRISSPHFFDNTSGQCISTYCAPLWHLLLPLLRIPICFMQAGCCYVVPWSSGLVISAPQPE